MLVAPLATTRAWSRSCFVRVHHDERDVHGDAQCLENVSKLRQIWDCCRSRSASSSSLLSGTWSPSSWKTRGAFGWLRAARWGCQASQALATAVTTSTPRWSARKSDIVSKNVRVDTRAPWSAHVAIAFDVVRKPAKIQTWQVVTPLPLVPQSSPLCREKWMARHRAAEHVNPNDPPQDEVVTGLLGPALGDSVELSQLFSKWSVASERHPKSECEMEGSARCGRAAAARGQLAIFCLKPIILKRVDDSASEGERSLILQTLPR